MTKQRLKDILDESKMSPELFRRDGHTYFIEALPLIEEAMALHEKKEKPIKEKKEKKSKKSK